MSKRTKGKTLVARDEGDDAYGVVIKVYGEETNRLGKPHGIRFFDHWIPELKAAYNLRLIGEGEDSSWAAAPPRTD